MTLSERYAERLAAWRATEPNSEELAKAKLCLIDFLACAFESRTLPWSRQAISLAGSDGGDVGPETAGIVGTAARATLADAVFANAVLGHGLVRDDMHLGSVSHLGAVVIPIVLGLGERRAATGRDVLSSIIGGYEAGGKFGRAVLDVEVSRIHRPTGIAGPVAAAAAGGTLLGLARDELGHALAFAANTIAGYNEWAAAGGSEMFFHPGFAARNALMSIALARAGARASPTVLDGPAGALAAFAKTATPDTPLPFDEPREIESVFFKEVPACNFAQSPAQAARELALEERISVASIERVAARVSFAAANYPGCDSTGPFEQSLQAKMSIQYNVAVALATGRFDETSYDPRRQRLITELAGKVVVEIDDELTRVFPGRQAAKLIVHDSSGRTISRRADDVVPASAVLVRERLVRSGIDAIGAEQTDALLRFIADMDEEGDAGTLVRLARSAS